MIPIMLHVFASGRAVMQAIQGTKLVVLYSVRPDPFEESQKISVLFATHFILMMG